MFVCLLFVERALISCPLPSPYQQYQRQLSTSLQSMPSLLGLEMSGVPKTNVYRTESGSLVEEEEVLDIGTSAQGVSPTLLRSLSSFRSPELIRSLSSGGSVSGIGQDQDSKPDWLREPSGSGFRRYGSGTSLGTSPNNNLHRQHSWNSQFTETSRQTSIASIQDTLRLAANALRTMDSIATLHV